MASRGGHALVVSTLPYSRKVDRDSQDSATDALAEKSEPQALKRAKRFRLSGTSELVPSRLVLFP